MTDINKLENLVLKRGGHRSPAEGLCLLEAVAYVAGEPHRDHPVCVDPVLGAFGRKVNDFMSDGERQLLVPIVSKLIGTKADYKTSLRRTMLLVDGAVRQILPLAMEAAGLVEHAAALRALGEVCDEPSARAAYYAAADAAYAAYYAAAAYAAAAARAAAAAADAAAYAACYAAADAAADAAAYAAAAYAAAYAAGSGRKPVIEALVKIFNAAIEVSP